MKYGILVSINLAHTINAININIDISEKGGTPDGASVGRPD